MPISGVNTGAVQSLTTADKVLGAPKVQELEAENRQLKPVMDEYVPEEPQEASGRYWVGRDGGGQPEIYFDNPERAADVPKQPEGVPDTRRSDGDAPEVGESDRADQGAKGPEGKRGRGEVWKCDTGKADREIEKLKKKQRELVQRLNTETDEAKIMDLKRQLAQVERELQQKDNDTYRKQNSTFTQLF